MSNQAVQDLLDRIELLESKLAFQEDTIEQLNQEITALNKYQAITSRQLELLADKFKEQKGSVVASEAEEVPPPHY